MKDLLLIVLLATLPYLSFAQSSTVEFDPAVVNILPTNYPLKEYFRRMRQAEMPQDALYLIITLEDIWRLSPESDRGPR